MKVTGDNGRTYEVVITPPPQIDAGPADPTPKIRGKLGAVLTLYDEDGNKCKLSEILGEGGFKFFDRDGSCFEVAIPKIE